MGRLTDALLTEGTMYRAEGDKQVLNLELGGQHGWAPNLVEWHNNQAYVSRPLHCIMLEAPKMFKHMPDGQRWVNSLKALFELHAYAIEGFNAELKVDTEGHDVGGAGEKQHEILNVTRETSTPKFTFIEKYGRPVQTLLDYWIRYGLMDPETKFALLGSVIGGANATGAYQVTDMLADWYSATCIFIVPDANHNRVDKAWLTTNMFPTSTGQITAKRDLKSGQELLTLDIEFPGLSQVGVGVNKFAQRILDSINLSKADPFMRTAFYKQEVNGSVVANGEGGRYMHSDAATASSITGYAKGAKDTGLGAVSAVGLPNNISAYESNANQAAGEVGTGSA